MADCTDADRVLVFPIINGDTYERSFEYWRKDLSFPGTDKRMVSIHWIPEYHQAFCEGRTVVIRDMEELRHEDAVIYHRFHVEGVEMLIAFPLMYRENCGAISGSIIQSWNSRNSCFRCFR